MTAVGRFGSPRTLNKLLEGSTARKLSETISTIIINVPEKRSPQYSNIKHFLYQHVPKLKYANPHIIFQLVYKSPTAQIVVHTAQDHRIIPLITEQPMSVDTLVTTFLEQTRS